MRYRVKTDIFAEINKGEVFETVRDGLIHDNEYLGFDITCVERNSQWFEKVDEWEVRIHGFYVDDEIDEFVKMGYARRYVTNGEIDIDLPSKIDGRQAEAICNALNSLDNGS